MSDALPSPWLESQGSFLETQAGESAAQWRTTATLFVTAARQALLAAGIVGCAIAAYTVAFIPRPAAGPASWLTLSLFAFSLASGFRRLGARRALQFLIASLLVGIVGHFAGHAVRRFHESPFGPDQLGWKLFGSIPVLIPVAWFILLYATYQAIGGLARCTSACSWKWWLANRRRVGWATLFALLAGMACAAWDSLTDSEAALCGVVPLTEETQLARGDHIVVQRGIYAHHGIYCGGGTVISYIKQDGGIVLARTPLAEYTRGAEVKVRKYVTCRSADETLPLVESLLGENAYNPFCRNCEHVATYCKTGRHESQQVATVALTVIGGICMGLGCALFRSDWRRTPSTQGAT